MQSHDGLLKQSEREDLEEELPVGLIAITSIQIDFDFATMDERRKEDLCRKWVEELPEKLHLRNNLNDQLCEINFEMFSPSVLRVR